MKYLLLLGMFFSLSLFGVIVEGEEGGVPLAIPDFNITEGTDQSKAGDQFIKSFGFDFNLSPFFKLLSPKSFIDPNDGMSATSIKFKNWKMVGAEYLIKGSYHIKDQKMMVTVRVFSVVEEKQVLGKKYTGDLDSIPSFAHFVAGDIYKFFTGQKAIFTTKIAFSRRVKGKKQIFVMNIDGTEQRAVTNNRYLNILPSWATANAILYTSYKTGAPFLYMRNIYSGHTLKLSGRDGLNTGGVLSPDQSKVALTLTQDGNSEVYIINAKNGKIIKRLTRNSAIDTSPFWSPDGKQIAFVSSRNFDPHIFIMNADGSNQTRITFQGNYNQTPRWSPKNDRILFTARDERNRFDIFYIDLKDENKISRLTQDEGNNEEPSWSPDGEFIVFTSNRKTGRSQIYIMDRAGKKQIRITNGKRKYYTPRWSPLQ